MIKICVTLKEGQGQYKYTWHIPVTEAVTVSNLIAIAVLLSEICDPLWQKGDKVAGKITR